MRTKEVALADAVQEQLAPALEAVGDAMRQGRRVLTRSEHAIEDAATAAALCIRQRPFSAVATAAGGGAIVGAVVGFAIGWATHRKS
jgi:ElaB/YqjD/DUF883 family membrane-anchored ribosome-binding protein